MGFFAKLKKRAGLGGAIVTYGMLRVLPWVVIIAAAILAAMKSIVAAEVEGIRFLLPDWIVVAYEVEESFIVWLSDWASLMALFISSVALLTIGFLFEGRVNDLEEREATTKTPEATTTEVAKDEKPTLTESAPTIDKNHKCMRSSCKRTRAPDPDRPLCPECWDHWTKKKPWRCVKCKKESPTPICTSCRPEWLEWLRS